MEKEHEEKTYFCLTKGETMEYQSPTKGLANWEIDTMIEMYGKDLLHVFSTIFDDYPDSIPKLHKRRNTFSNNEYDHFTSLPIHSYREVLKEIQNESHFDATLYESPLFSKECSESSDSWAMRIPIGSKISSTFQISYCLDYYESEVMEGKCKKGDVTFVAGELNHKSYGKLKEYYFDLIMGKGLKTIPHINCFAGPDLSCPDDYNIDKDSLADSNYFITLFLKNQYQDKIRLYRVKRRSRFHFIVHQFNDKLCLIEDPHPEFHERAATMVFNNPALCNTLRSIADSFYNSSSSTLLQNEDDIRGSLMHECDIRKRSCSGL
jgi:hypothetical protein